MASKNGDLFNSLNKFEAYKTNANEAIRFKLVKTESDLEEDGKAQIFRPEMTHQIFGESENIFGYKDLTIDIFCTAARMVTYVGVKYSEKINPKKHDGVEADDILKMLAIHLQSGFLTNLDSFTLAIQEDAKFKPFGVLVHYCTKLMKDSHHDFEIYFVEKPSKQFIDYHERLQPFLLFYVDAASYISADDDKWNYYLIYETYKGSNGRKAFALVGYMTVYNFYAYPDKIRPRISQVLIMPPYQQQGHGATLLETFYKQCWTNDSVLDITVEDPSEAFQRLRDFVDCFNCQRLPAFQPYLLRRGFSERMVNDARTQLKISRRQSRRVYEILRLKHTNCFDDKEFKAYRIDVKRRLNAPYQKNSRHLNRLCGTLNPQELAAALSMTSDERRIELIEQQFQSCVNEYRQVLDRLEVDTSIQSL